MAEIGKVPVQESVGAALRFLRENAQFSAVLAVAGAAVATVIAMISLKVAALGVPLSVLSTFVAALIYAGFTIAALDGAAGVGQRIVPDGGRVWAAMLVVGFFLCIVFIVLAIPGFILLGAILGPRYAADLQGVSGDQAASVALMERMVSENPGVWLGFALVYGLIWLALTSRLFLSAPASIDAKRILTFETWPWTKGNMLRIMGARLMLLAPAYILVSAISYILALSLGINILDPESLQSFSQSNTAMFALFSFVTTALQLFLFRSLEAGLSAYLYRGLKPQGGAVPPAV